MDLHEIDVRRLRRDALGEDHLPLRRHLGHQVVGKVRRSLAAADLAGEKPPDLGRGPRLAVALGIVIPAAPGLLPLAAGPDENVAERLRHRLAPRPRALALEEGDVEAAEALVRQHDSA